MLLNTVLPHWVTTPYYLGKLPVYLSLNDDKHLSMRDIFHLIKDYCGEVCDTTIGPSERGKYFDVVEKHIDCDRLFSDNLLEGWEQQSTEEAPPHLEYLVLTCINFLVSYFSSS